MDNVTHALAGLLLAEATVAVVNRRSTRPITQGFRRTAAIVGVVTAELPDADLIYSGTALGMGKLGYLLHHRGHTHTLLFAVFAALLVWGIALAFRRGRPAMERWAMLGLALAGTLSHIALDYTNSYGVHPFWPVDNSWFYGDAVFIVEPWFWIIGLVPLMLIARQTAGRVVAGLFLAGILAAAWTVGQVPREVAATLTLGTALWLALLAVVRPGRRLPLALGAWVAAEAVFFAASFAARRAITAQTGATLRDAVLTPAIGNPFCVGALVVELDGPTYRVSTAVVAPVPSLRDVDACTVGRSSVGDGTGIAGRPSTAGMRWGATWSAPHAELLALVASNCEIAAALRFIRVPVWRWRDDGTVHFADLRYGGSGDGFADLVTPARVPTCPPHVPDWVPPRQDILTERPAVAVVRTPPVTILSRAAWAVRDGVLHSARNPD